MEDLMTQQRNRLAAIVVVVVVVLALVAPVAAAQSAKKEHPFRGKVEQVDTKAKTLTVNGEKVEGWMGAMTMTYKVDKAEAVAAVKAGDEIAATVYDGDFTTLHDVKVVPPADKKK
jgi:Cu/Ag efflux protein CusF